MQSIKASRTRSSPVKLFAYVGTYSSPVIPKGGRGNGLGIYLLQMDPTTGMLKERRLFRDLLSPSWLAFDPSRTHLYAANEMAVFEGMDSGSISAFSINSSTGNLKPLNTVSSEGAGPVYVSVHPSGRYVMAANYEGGTISILPIGAHGKLLPATDVKQGWGSIGPTRAKSAPPGSFAISGHDRTRPHMIQADLFGRYILSTDVATDRIYVWNLNLDKGTLSPVPQGGAKLPGGDGPRHFVFHPNGRWLYSLQEEASTLVLFDYDTKHGRLTPRQTVSTLPSDFRGTNLTSQVIISPGRKFLYVANRFHDSIAQFAIGATGILNYRGEVWTRGDYPRNINFDPQGRFLYCCNQRSDAVTSYKINGKTGELIFTGQYLAVGSPAIILF